jgi:hypothetical protein
LRRSAIDVIAVGDAHAPRGVMAAVHEAHGVGNRI